MRKVTVRNLIQAVLRADIDQFKRILDNDQDQDTKNQASNEQILHLVAQIISSYKTRSLLVQDLDSAAERAIRQNMMGLLVAAYSRGGAQPVVARRRFFKELPLNRWDIAITEEHQEFLFKLLGRRGTSLLDMVFGNAYFSTMNWLRNFAICSVEPSELQQHVKRELPFLINNSLMPSVLCLVDAVLGNRLSILPVGFFENFLRTIQGERSECVSKYNSLFWGIQKDKCVYFLNELLSRGLQLDERRGAKHLITLLTAIASEDSPVVLRQIAEFVECLNFSMGSIPDPCFAAKLQFFLQCNRDFFSSDVDKRIRAERFCKLYVAIEKVNDIKSFQIREGYGVQLLNPSLSQTALDPQEFHLFMENLSEETGVNRASPFYHLEDYLELARQIMVSANLSEHEKGLRLSYLNSRVEGLLQAAEVEGVPLGSQFVDEAEEASLSGDIRDYPTLVEIQTILDLRAGRSARPSSYIDAGFFRAVPVDASSSPAAAATASLPRPGVASRR